MVNILFIFETEMPTVELTKNFWSNIPREYNITSRFIKLVDITKEALNWCDVLLLIRPNNALSWRIAVEVRRTKRFVITMCDDDLLHLPKTHPDLPWQKKGLIKALNSSSVILSSNQYIIDRMINYTSDKRAAHMDTVVKPEELIGRHYQDGNVVKLVYAAGGGQHEHLFERIVLPALKSIAVKNPGKISVTFVSVHPNCGGLGNDVQIEYVKGMPLFEYRRFMEENQFDIAIAPLEDNDFAKCKYFNKYLEYTLSGIVGVYSKVEPYTYVISDGVNGLLADNVHQSWEDKLLEAINDFDLRKTCALNAQKHVRQSFNEKRIMERLFSEIPELQHKNVNYNECKYYYAWRYYYQFLRVIEYIYKTFFYMRTEGFDSVKRKISARLKKMGRCL